MYDKTFDFVMQRLTDATLFNDIDDMITALQARLKAASAKTEPITSLQIGFLVAAMGLKERQERIAILSALLGWDLVYVEPIPGMKPEQIGEPSVKDARITKSQGSILIGFFLEDYSHELLKQLGYSPKNITGKAGTFESRPVTASVPTGSSGKRPRPTIKKQNNDDNNGGVV